MAKFKKWYSRVSEDNFYKLTKRLKDKPQIYGCNCQGPIKQWNNKENQP